MVAKDIIAIMFKMKEYVYTLLLPASSLLIIFSLYATIMSR